MKPEHMGGYSVFWAKHLFFLIAVLFLVVFAHFDEVHLAWKIKRQLGHWPTCFLLGEINRFMAGVAAGTLLCAWAVS